MLEQGPSRLFTPITGGWRRLFVIAAFDILAGLIAVAWPGVTVVVLAVVFGIVLVLTGAVVLSLAFLMRSLLVGLLGILALIAGIVCLAHPGAGIFAILVGCAIWFLMLGVAYLGQAVGGRDNRLWWAALGTLSVIAGIVMLASPGVAIATVGLLVGISFLVRGAAELVLGRRLRALHRAFTR